MKVSSVGEMRVMDRQAIEGLGIPEAILMSGKDQFCDPREAPGGDVTGFGC